MHGSPSSHGPPYVQIGQGSASGNKTYQICARVCLAVLRIPPAASGGSSSRGFIALFHLVPSQGLRRCEFLQLSPGRFFLVPSPHLVFFAHLLKKLDLVFVEAARLHQCPRVFKFLLFRVLVRLQLCPEGF